MKKTPALFKRGPDGELTDEYNLPAAQWVVDGEGVATRKWDGTAVYFKDGVWWKRYDSKHGKPPPEGGIACQPAPDPGPAGHWPFWVLVGDGPADRWIREAIATAFDGTDPEHHPWEGWTYEAVGPKIGGNPEGFTHHDLVSHGTIYLLGAPRTYHELRDYLRGRGIEGIVWWRDPQDPTCDKVKITAAALHVPR